MEFRRLCDTNPNNDDPSFAAHARECAACARELERARKFDELLEGAMRIDVPGARSQAWAERRNSPAAERARKKHAWLAVAASLVLALAIGGGVWLGARPKAILAADVVEHIREEPDSLREDRPAVDPGVARELLARRGIRLAEQIGTISYVRLCPFKGQQIVHLVVETGSGPVTILLLDDHLRGPITVDEAGYSGRIVPSGKGSIAIVGFGRHVEADEQDRMVEAVRWEA